MNANVGTSQGLAPDGPIELFFDRLLLADSVSRQTFPITDLNGNVIDNPHVFYDPVARSVTLTHLSPYQPCQVLRVYLLTPSDGSLGGLQALDGATLDPSTPQFIEFPVLGSCASGSDAGPPATAPVVTFPTIDFCGSVFPIFASKCSGPTCHGGDQPAAGLRLDTSQGIVDTAIGRVSIEANQGPSASAEPPSNGFLDMPIIDRGSTENSGDPADSWLLYKLLLAVPPACSSTPGAGPCDAGAPTVEHNYHSRPWTEMSSAERAVLASYMVGREMPYPADPSAAPGSATEPLTLDELETVSLWIAQGASVPSCQ